jgi:RNA polymerase sigma factor (sigma-70 family)
MPGGAQASVVRSIQTLFGAGSFAGLPDSQLLDRFLSGRDAEAAFAALVSLHGPMVWDLCRSILRDQHDAEDAFQATFMILVQKAGVIRQRDSIGPWLYGVARRVAVRAKNAAAIRRVREGGPQNMRATPMADPAPHEKFQALHEEVDRLAEKYRAAVVLCYFHGRSHSQAARLLNCPVSTVSVRLARARTLLRARLSRRGVALPAAGVGVTLLPASTRAATPAALAESTMEAAIRIAAGEAATAGVVSASVTKLMEAALRTTVFQRAAVSAASVAVIGFAAAAAILLPRAGPSARVEQQAIPAPSAQAPAEPNQRDFGPPVIARDREPVVEFFGIRSRALSLVYAIDSSGSMSTRDSLVVAKRELLESINRLSPESRFAVIFYEQSTRFVADAQGRRGLMAPTKENKASVERQLVQIEPAGGTDHMVAFRAALALKPEVIFFLTDADLMANADVDEILGEVGSTSIMAVEFGRGNAPDKPGPFRRLAAATHGSYVYKDVTRFPRSKRGH